ncbi:abhydrolase domain-containing protein 4 [Mytilus galloprovincialis]|uniref:Abhydrolase domain-containing protein 4 n=1 Tax=Mytilus galloprovincialis TaxID=29158 RepID=A0A8B6FIQ7_MYTGA|nr:abhydrolase domain-containing protein 4 [Mytilus galloprovincialis]
MICGEIAFKSISLGPYIWAKNPMIFRAVNLPKDLPVSILYGSESWMDKTAGYQVQTARDSSYVTVQKIPDAGHHVYADRSDIFNVVVSEICKAADQNSVVSHDKLEDIILSFESTKDKEMNSVLIPDIHRLMSGPYHRIDNFTTLCEELEDHLDPSIDEVRMEKMISIMKRLIDYKTDEVFPKMNELFYTLTETVFSVVESQENWSLSESAKPSVARVILDKFQKMIVGGRILPKETLTEKKCHKRYKQVREYKEVQDLKKLIENHEKIYQELQEQQKKCWFVNDKVTFVTDLLERKKTFFAEYEDQFSPKNHEQRKDFMDFLQEKLERKMEKAAKITGKYQTLLNAESVAKDKVRQIT